MKAVYRWLCEPASASLPAWVDRGCIVFTAIGFCIGLVLGVRI